MYLKSPVPIFRIFDEAKALEFYVEFLGFNIDWVHRFGENFPLYMQISQNYCVIQLSEHYGDACPGSAIQIETTGLDELCQALNEKGYAYAKPSTEDAPWGDREMRLTDPFGNRLTFFEKPPG